MFKLIRLLQCRYVQGSSKVQQNVSRCVRKWAKQQGAVERFAQYDSHWLQFFGRAVEDGFLRDLRELVRQQTSRHGRNAQLRHHRLNENELTVLSLAHATAPIEPSGPKPWKVGGKKRERKRCFHEMLMR